MRTRLCFRAAAAEQQRLEPGAASKSSARKNGSEHGDQDCCQRHRRTHGHDVPACPGKMSSPTPCCKQHEAKSYVSPLADTTSKADVSMYMLTHNFVDLCSLCLAGNLCKRTHFDFAFLVPYLSPSPCLPYSMMLSHYALSNVPPLHQQPQTDMKDEMKQEAVDAVVRYVSSIDSTYYTCIHTTHVPSAQRCKRHPDTHLFPQPFLRESRLLSFYRFNPSFPLLSLCTSPLFTPQDHPADRERLL